MLRQERVDQVPREISDKAAVAILLFLAPVLREHHTLHQGSGLRGGMWQE